MSKKEWGSPEKNNIMSIDETVQQAVQRGYFEQLKAIGLGRGLDEATALEQMASADVLQVYKSDSEIFKDFENLAIKIRVDSSKNTEVSTGDVNDKGQAPAVLSE